jgi:hypothetical protein
MLNQIAKLDTGPKAIVRVILRDGKKSRAGLVKPVVSSVMRVACGRWKLKDHRHEAGGLRRYASGVR